MSHPATRRPRTLAASVRVLEFTLGEMFWSRRTIFMVVLVAAPVVIGLALRVVASLDALDVSGTLGRQRIGLTGSAIFGLMVWGLYLRFAVPVLGAFYGTALIADEVEDKTLTYLFTRPISRGTVLVGKYAGYLVCTSLVVLPSVTLVYFIVVPLLGGSIGASFPILARDVGLLALGLAVYGALFALIGAWLKRPLLTGLVFVFGWEPIAVMVPGYMKYLTVAYYLQGLVPHAAPQQDSMSLLRMALQVFQTPLPAWMNVVMLVAIWAGALLGAVWVVERREYVLDQ